MHMAAIGQELGVRRIVIPHSASVHGAFGVVSADVVQTDVTTRTLRVPVEPDEVNAIFARLTRRVADRLLAAGFLPEDIVVQRSINMRYRRQVHVLTTPVDGDGVLTPPDLEKVSGRFEEIYAERYGKDAGYREAGLEMVAFLARGVARLRKPHVRPAEPGPPDPRSAFVESRVAYFGGVDEMREAHCYDFQRLRPGHTVAGPAIVWTPITTVVVQPGQTATCDPWKNLVVTW
jgi:N-methylhydantoinase A